MRGIVTKVIFNRGYCFVRGEDGISRFAHCRDFVDRVRFDLLHEGQPVTFTPDVDPTRDPGQRAIKVEIEA